MDDVFLPAQHCQVTAQRDCGLLRPVHGGKPAIHPVAPHARARGEHGVHSAPALHAATSGSMFSSAVPPVDGTASEPPGASRTRLASFHRASSVPCPLNAARTMVSRI